MICTLRQITQDESPGKMIYLLRDKTYIVGRKSADILIENDASISRYHANIKFENNSAVLTDCKSKYGTFLDGNKIDPGVGVPLTNNCQIKFGVFQSLYKFETTPFITTGSSLSSEKKLILKKISESVGFQVINNWTPDCTHLTLQEIILTVKVLHAIIDDKPLVTIEYWKKMFENIKNGADLPKTDDFKPPLNESLINENIESENADRKTLFKTKIFVFPNNKVKDKMKEVIEKCGGTCISWENSPVSKYELHKSHDQYIFVNTEELGEIPESLKAIHQTLFECGERTIPIREIAHAIYICSCEKDCNPLFNRLNEVFNVKAEPEVPNQDNPLAPESQTQDVIIQCKREIVIPGSLETNVADLSLRTCRFIEKVDNVNKNISSEKHDKDVIMADNENETPPPKRIKLDVDQEVLLSQVMSQDENEESRQILSAVAANNQKETQEKSAEDQEQNPFKMPRLSTTKKLKQRIISSDLSLKRKTDAVEKPEVTKKSKILPNPLSKASKSDKDDDVNPFLMAKSQKIDTITPNKSVTQSTNDNSIFKSSQSSDGSNFSSNDRTITNFNWLSKNSANLNHIKLDDDFKSFYELFNNSLKIERIQVVPRRIEYNTPSNTGNRNVKNFKKFKKVAPVRSQTNIIAARNIIFAGPKANESVRRSSDGEDDEEYAKDQPSRALLRNKLRKFNF